MKRLHYFGAAVIITLIYGTLYTVVQQVQRHDANSPQIQIAEDTASALNQHTAPATLVSGKVDLATSLAPFVTIYDTTGHVVTSSGYLNNAVPVIPRGVLQAAVGQPYHFVTWQPRADVRIAAVTVAAQKYYVLSGRSLKEVERNEAVTFRLSALGWLLTMITLVGMWGLRNYSFKLLT